MVFSVRNCLTRSLGLPAVDLIKRTRQVETYRELMATQWLGEEQLEDIALKRLRRVLLHAQEHVPYYRRLFSERTFSPERLRGFEDLRKLPVLTKEEVRRNENELVADNAKAFSPRRRQTSGSTGQPLRYLASRDSHSVIWASNWRAFSVVGYRPGDSVASLSGGALMPYTTSLKQRAYALCMGLVQLPAYHLNSEEMASYAVVLRERIDIKYLFSYASAAFLLARYLLNNRVDGTMLRSVFTTSEVLSPLQRQTIERGFGCPVHDTYGNNESGLYAFECEAFRGLHYGLESSYLEVLDENDRKVADGATGRLVATSLSNYVMPIIRYDTGDLGSLAPGRCPCGRGLPRIKEILGRSRDFVTTPDGREIHGAFFNHFEPFYRTSWIAGWHVLQDEPDHLLITLRPDGEPCEADIDVIRSLLARSLGPELRVEVQIDPRLFVTPAGKQKVIESRVGEAPISPIS